MLKKLFITGLVCLLAGVTAIGWLTIHRKQWAKMQAEYKNKYSSHDADYLHRYRLWLEVPEYQRSEFPWSIDADTNSGTLEEIRRHQNERFIADFDSLSNIDSELYPVARLFYGENWQKRLEEYKKQREIEETGFVAAVLSSCLGAVLILSWGFWWVSGKLYCLFNSLKNMKKKTAKPKLKTEKQTEIAKPKPKTQRTTEIAKPKLKTKRTSETAKPKLKTERTSEDVKITRNIISQKPEAINETLTKLTEEVAAIRRCTGQQQDKFRNLREGYDWNIIRNFALRVIRCIDNLEKRISDLDSNDSVKYHLEEIRDELVFALESSGLERYKPDVNSKYRGQEKIAEAVKDKNPTDRPRLKGTISEVIRWGYRYMIDEENFKVIRAAQVKLFG